MRNQTSVDSRREFIIAAANRQYEKVQQFLDQGIDPDAVPEGKPSALCYAVLGADLDLAWLLIKKGADVNFQDSLGNTPSIYAVLSASVDCLTLLVRWGADLSVRNKYDKVASNYTKNKGLADIEIKRVLRLSPEMIERDDAEATLH